MAREASSILSDVLRVPISLGIYENYEEAIREVVTDFVLQKIEYYRSRIAEYEKKHGSSFADFTLHLSDKATISDEDDWMEWEADMNLLKAWEKTYAEIKQSDDSRN